MQQAMLIFRPLENLVPHTVTLRKGGGVGWEGEVRRLPQGVYGGKKVRLKSSFIILNST